MDEKQGFDSRLILAIGLSLVIWWLWNKHIQEKYPALNQPKTEVSQTTKNEKAKVESPEGSRTALLSPPSFSGESSREKTWEYEDSVVKMTVSSLGGRVSAVSLKKYVDRRGKMVSYLTPDLPGFLLTSIEGDSNSSQFSHLNYDLKPTGKDSIELTANRDGLRISKKLQFLENQYVVKVHTELSGDLSKVKRLNTDISMSAKPVIEPKTGLAAWFSGSSQDMHEFVFNYSADKMDRLSFSPEKPPKPDETKKGFEQTHYAAVGSRYFTSMLYNRSNVVPEGQSIRDENVSVLRFGYPVLERTSPYVIDYDLYAGPKSISQLSLLDESATRVVDYGKFSWIAVPMLSVMRWFYGMFKNWGIAIIALTILVRIVTLPFAYMSIRSAKAMQKIQPEMARLREIYKDRPQEMNLQIMKLMKDNKANPMSGCLPMFLQLPVFFALFQVLQNSIELYHSPFFGWIRDLSLRDPLYVLPVLMGVTMFIQQKMTPTTMDPAQARVMMVMPLMITFMMANLPSGLTLYMFVSTLFGIIQQILMMKDGASAKQAMVRRA